MFVDPGAAAAEPSRKFRGAEERVGVSLWHGPIETFEDLALLALDVRERAGDQRERLVPLRVHWVTDSLTASRADEDAFDKCRIGALAGTDAHGLSSSLTVGS